MALVYINTGTSSNKGDGDTLRTAFTKINGMFRELYSSLIPQVATISTAGVVKPGVGLSVSVNGTLNVTGAASTSTLTILDDSGNPGLDIRVYAGTTVLPSDTTTPAPLFTFDKNLYKMLYILLMDYLNN